MTVAQLAHSHCCPSLAMERNAMQDIRRAVPSRQRARSRAGCLFLKSSLLLHCFGPGHFPSIFTSPLEMTHKRILASLFENKTVLMCNSTDPAIFSQYFELSLFLLVNLWVTFESRTLLYMPSTLGWEFSPYISYVFAS